MAKDILKALAEQRAHDEAMATLQARAEAWSRMHIISTGFQVKYTDEEIAEIELLRAEMRERLTCPDDQYDEVCRRHAQRTGRDINTMGTMSRGERP